MDTAVKPTAKEGTSPVHGKGLEPTVSKDGANMETSADTKVRKRGPRKTSASPSNTYYVRLAKGSDGRLGVVQVYESEGRAKVHSAESREPYYKLEVFIGEVDYSGKDPITKAKPYSEVVNFESAKSTKSL